MTDCTLATVFPWPAIWRQGKTPETALWPSPARPCNISSDWQTEQPQVSLFLPQAHLARGTDEPWPKLPQIRQQEGDRKAGEERGRITHNQRKEVANNTADTAQTALEEKS